MVARRAIAATRRATGRVVRVIDQVVRWVVGELEAAVARPAINLSTLRWPTRADLHIANVPLYVHGDPTLVLDPVRRPRVIGMRHYGPRTGRGYNYFLGVPDLRAKHGIDSTIGSVTFGGKAAGAA